MRILIAILILMQAYWGYLLRHKIVPGEVAEVKNNIGKTLAVLTIDYGEPVKGFKKDEFYILKCLKIRGHKVDYGFCPVESKEFYKTEDM